MELDIGLGYDPAVIGLDRFFERIPCLLKVRYSLRCDPLTRKLDTEDIECPSYLQDIRHVLFGDLGDHCTLSGDHRDKSLELEHADRFPYGRTAYPELIAEVNLHQSFACG